MKNEIRWTKKWLGRLDNGLDMRYSIIWVEDQVRGDIPGEEISKQSLIDEKASEFEASKWDISDKTYVWVSEFGQSIGPCWPTV